MVLLFLFCLNLRGRDTVFELMFEVEVNLSLILMFCIRTIKIKKQDCFIAGRGKMVLAYNTILFSNLSNSRKSTNSETKLVSNFLLVISRIILSLSTPVGNRIDSARKTGHTAKQIWLHFTFQYRIIINRKMPK